MPAPVATLKPRFRFAGHGGARATPELDRARGSAACFVYVTPPAAPTPEQWVHALALELRAAYACLRRRSNQLFEPLGMTSDQYVLLDALATHGDCTQQDLTRHCSSDTATIGAMITLLAGRKLVVRRPHPADGRAWSLALTPAGRSRLQQLRRRSAPFRRRLAAQFPPGECEFLIARLQALTNSLRPTRRRRERSGRPAI